MLVDSHCHLTSASLQQDLALVLASTKSSGISEILTLATEPENWEANLNLCTAETTFIRCALGVHPCSVTACPPLEETMSLLQNKAAHHHVLAIGETGLDYYHPAPSGWTEEAYRQTQRDFLRAHFQLAKELNKPIVLHSRDKQGNQSILDCLALAKEFHLHVRCQFHCHLGPWNEIAEEVIRLNGVFSYGGIATFSSAKTTTLAAAIAAPKGTFMLETDAPYLAPTPHRGKRNEPKFLNNTAQFLAEQRGESLEEFATHTTRTAHNFFHWR